MSQPTVLLVDDEANILSSLHRSLRREPWHVVTASSPAEALKQLDEISPVLVVSDQQMPGMTGIELLAEAGRRLPRVRRVLLTGWPEMVRPEEIEAAGIDAVVSKPWENEELLDILRRLVAS